MRLLLDTPVLLWILEEKPLSAAAYAVIQNSANEVFVSIVSFWEIAIKESLGKLRMPKGWEEQVDQNHFQYLPLELQHIQGLQSLPPLHKDPYDRMLISQAQVDNLRLVTRDRHILEYPLECMEA